MKEYRAKTGCVLLGVSPMSSEIVDAVIEFANRHQVPLMLIASRRQVDTEEFGGGYVNGWTPKAFADYVRAKDSGGYVAVCRDHGGPWQNPQEIEQDLDLAHAMESAKRAFTADLEAGFDIIHIDPSVDPHAHPSMEDILNRVFELYTHCVETSQRLGRQPLYEVGTEEQSGRINEPAHFEHFVKEIERFCVSRRYPLPTFVVGQIGTLVKETENVGWAATNYTVNDDVKEIIRICDAHGFWLKAHNCDYLSDENHLAFTEMGVHAANIGPEFGVTQTRALIDICNKHRLTPLLDRFLDLAHASRRWEKWMVPEQASTVFKKGIIAGHYVFGTEGFGSVMDHLRSDLGEKGVDVDAEVRMRLDQLLTRATINLGYFSEDHNWRRCT